MPELRLHRRLDEIPGAAWNALNRDGHPFTAHAFLSGLEQHGCLDPEYGWTPLHAALWDGDAVLAAAPAYAKGNSHGEFVFDHAWANAYAQYGIDYYPKWLIGVPYSPVTGPRLLSRDLESKNLLLASMREAAPKLGLHSLHANFLDAEDLTAFDDGELDGASAGSRWLAREDVQFHWTRDPAWHSFDDFLGALDHKRRKNLKADRRKVAEAGVRLRVLDGHVARGDAIAAMHRFYAQTFAEKWNHAAMTEAFFQHLCETMPDAVVLIIAEHDGQPIAGALCLRSDDALYGRYWGATVEVPGLHFEACYHQGIAYCIERGIDRFEPGAQGEHKLACAVLSTATHFFN